MKNLFKILVPSFLALALTSCIATTGSDSYAYNDNYSQGYSDGYRDGYYQSPDGYWYAPNVVYLDYNNNYYRNGTVYNSGSRNRRNVIISPRRNSLSNQIPSGTRTQNNTVIRSGTNSGTRNPSQNNTGVRPNNGIRNQSQNNTGVHPNANSGIRNQSQNNVRVQPQSNTRSESQNNNRTQPQVQQENNSQRSSGRR